MEWRDLAGPLVQAGASIAGTAIGGPAGSVVGNLIGTTLAKALGTDATPEAVATAIQNDPDATDKLQAAEAEHSDAWAAVAADGAKLMAQLAAKETGESFFAWGWRPALSWLIGLIIAQSFLVAPWMQAIAGKSVAVPYDNVVGIAAIWLTIYGGGHTAKAIFGKRLSG